MSSELLAVANNTENWALLPSDPAVFNDMLKEYGTKDIKVQEVYSLDFEYLKKESPIHGMIFASECKDENLPDDFDQLDPASEQITYAAQIVTNICGTLALLAILFNVDVSRGDVLNSFLEFTQGFNPIDRGMALGNSPFIYKVHHAYTASQHQNDPRMIDMDTENLKNTEDLIEVANYHYVSYIYKNGHVWELDGLKGRPIKLSECDEATWLDALKPILEERMNASNDEGIAFNLMAVIHDSLSSKKAEANTYQDCIDQIEQVKEFESQAAQAHKDGFFSKYLNNNLTGYPVMQELWDARIQQEESTITEKATKLNELKDSVQDEIKIVETDNDVIMADVCRLKTDYFPFIEELLRAAYKKGILPPKKKKRGRKPKNTKKVEKHH